MTHRVGTKGQVVIPVELRTKLGLQPGDEVEFRLDGSAVVMELPGAGGFAHGQVRRAGPCTRSRGRTPGGASKGCGLNQGAIRRWCVDSKAVLQWLDGDALRSTDLGHHRRGEVRNSSGRDT